MKKVEDFEVTKDTSLDELQKKYFGTGGFVAKKVGQATEILRKMQETEIKILSFPAALIATGTRGLIKEVCRKKMFDMVMTTCGTLDHDFSRVWKDYYHGSFDDSDAELYKKETHRLGNIHVPMASHGKIIEEKIQPMLAAMYADGKRELATYELVWELGKRLEREQKHDESIIYWCWKNKIPMIIPGITDGTFGLQLMMFMQDHKDFTVNVWKDELFLAEKMFAEVKTGALMVGGGISKHHTIWWAQFAGGLDYAVYITTAPEWDGSLSGARIREGISWGKVKEGADFVTVEGDATVILPLVLGPLL